MKFILMVLITSFCFTSFTTTKTVDTFEVLYDSKLIGKEGIKLEAGKSLQVVNKTSGKVYKVELSVVLGKRPCYQKTYLNEEAMKPILVTPFAGASCSDATMIMLAINVSTYINIPLIK